MFVLGLKKPSSPAFLKKEVLSAVAFTAVTGLDVFSADVNKMFVYSLKFDVSGCNPERIRRVFLFNRAKSRVKSRIRQTRASDGTHSSLITHHSSLIICIQ